MMTAIILFSYIIMTYGLCNLIIYGDGPFNVLGRFRNTMSMISPSMGKLVTCPMCLATNIGWVLSIINWLYIPIAFTPFNIILGGTTFWYLIILFDAAFTSGLTWLLFQVDDLIDSKKNNGGDDHKENERVLLVEDIVLKGK